MMQRCTDAAAAEALLGPEHPLTTALRHVVTSARQLGAVLTVGVVGLLGSAAGSSFGPSLALTGGLVGIVLAVRLWVARDRARDRARDAIIAGEEHLPIGLVRHQRDRLLRCDVREHLAAMYDDLARRAAPAHHRATGGAAVDIGRRLALAHDFRGVARLLRDASLDAPRIALAERLLEDRSSPLYGADIDALREALHPIELFSGARREAVRGR